MRHIQPLLLPQPCQSLAHRGDDRTVPNPCFLSPQTVHIRVRILNLIPQSTTVVISYLTITPRRRPYIFLPQVKLCPFVAYHHDKKTPIHLLAAGLTVSGSGLVYSNPRTMKVL